MKRARESAIAEAERLVLVGEDEVGTGAEKGDEAAVGGEAGEDDAVRDVGVEVYEGVGLGGAERMTTENEPRTNGCCRAERDMGLLRKFQLTQHAQSCRKHGSRLGKCLRGTCL